MEYRIFKDQMGYEVNVSFPPQRIISLVPSHTELLYDLGLEKQVCGLTKFCIRPADKVKGIPRIGGTKDFSIEKILQLQPDLIIANKEENEKEKITELKKHCPVWMSDIYTVEEALSMIRSIGQITDRAAEAINLAYEISSSFKFSPFTKPLKVLYFIWKNPYMVAASNTFIDSVLQKCGFSNAAGQLTRYPILSEEEIQGLNPDILFLSTEPYPFKEKHFPAFRELAPKAKTVIVDGEIFSWYGSRMKYISDYINSLKKRIF